MGLRIQALLRGHFPNIALCIALLVAVSWAAPVAAQTRAAEEQRIAIEGRKLLTAGDAVQARKFLEQALQERPNAGAILAAYADVLTVQKQPAMANAARFKGCAFGSEDACRQLRLDPRPSAGATTVHTLGSKCIAEGIDAFYSNPKVAVDRFSCAVQAVPQSGYAHGSLALALVRAGRGREAHEILTKACELGHKASCGRLELISDLAPRKAQVAAAATDSVRPTDALFLHDGRVLAGRANQVGGRWVVSTLSGVEEVPAGAVKERYVLVEVSELAGPAKPWRAGAWEWGLGLGYAANVQGVDLGVNGDQDRTLHLLSGAVTGGHFFSDVFELAGQLRAAGALQSAGSELFLQLSAAALFHAPVGGAVFAGGPFAGVEIGLATASTADSQLKHGAGPLVGAQAGFKFDLGRQMALRSGISMGYARVMGERGDGASHAENRLRALFEVELLWYPAQK